MPLIKTSELVGVALDYAVAHIQKTLPSSFNDWRQTWPRYSSKDVSGGSVIDQHFIDTYCMETEGPIWEAEMQKGPKKRARGRGHTRLVAAMRCLVAHELGDKVEIPGELLLWQLKSLMESLTHTEQKEMVTLLGLFVQTLNLRLIAQS